MSDYKKLRQLAEAATPGPCRHRRTKHMRWADGAWADVAYGVNCWPGWLGTKDAAVVCGDCGAWLPLGHSDETPERVAVEIMAAEIVADLDSFGCTDGDTQTCPGCGWADYDTDDVPPTPQREAGWLARVIATHKETP